MVVHFSGQPCEMEEIKKLTKDQIADFRDAFSLFKADSEGNITARELG